MTGVTPCREPNILMNVTKNYGTPSTHIYSNSMAAASPVNQLMKSPLIVTKLEISEREHEIRRLKRQLTEALDRIYDLEIDSERDSSNLKQREARINTLQNEIDTLMNRNFILEEQLEEFKNGKEESMQAYMTRAFEAESKSKELVRTLTSLTKDNDQLTEENSKLSNQLQNLKTKIRTLEIELRDYSVNAINVSTHRREVNNCKEKFEDEKVSLVSQMEIQQKEIEYQKELIADLRIKMDSSDFFYSRHKDESGENLGEVIVERNLKEKIDNLEEERDELLDKVTDKEIEYEKFKKIYEECSAKLQATEKGVVELEKQNTSLNETIKELESFREEAETKINEITDKLVSERKKSEALNEAIESMTIVLENNKCQIEDKEITIQELRGNLTNYDSQIANLGEENHCLSKRIDELTKEVQSKDAKAENLLTEIDLVQKDLKKSVEENLIETQKFKSEIANLNEDIQNKSVWILELQNANEEQQRLLEELQNSYDEQQNNLQKLKNTNDDQHIEMYKLKNTNDEHIKSIHELECTNGQQLENLKSLQKTVNDQEIIIKESEKVSENLKEAQKSFEQKLEQATNEIRYLDKKRKNLEKEINDINTNSMKEKEELTCKLNSQIQINEESLISWKTNETNLNDRIQLERSEFSRKKAIMEETIEQLNNQLRNTLDEKTTLNNKNIEVNNENKDLLMRIESLLEAQQIVEKNLKNISEERDNLKQIKNDLHIKLEITREEGCVLKKDLENQVKLFSDRCEMINKEKVEMKESLSAKIIEYEKTINDNANLINKLTEDIKNLEKDNINKTRELSERNELIEKKNDLILEKNFSLEEIEATIRDLNCVIDSKSVELTKKETLVVELDQEINSLKQELESVNNERESIIASKSTQAKSIENLRAEKEELEDNFAKESKEFQKRVSNLESIIEKQNKEHMNSIEEIEEEMAQLVQQMEKKNAIFAETEALLSSTRDENSQQVNRLEYLGKQITELHLSINEKDEEIEKLKVCLIKLFVRKYLTSLLFRHNMTKRTRNLPN